MAGLMKKMRENIAKSGASKKQILYFPSGVKKRIRFLQELDDGFEFVFHYGWKAGVDCLCPREIDEDNECEYCGLDFDWEDEMKIDNNTRYVWSVWDYEAGEVKILLFKSRGVTPIDNLLEYNNDFGTLMDRDYVIKKVGKMQSMSWNVSPGEISQFNSKKKAKAYTEKQLLDILSKSFKYMGDGAVDDDDEEETKPKRKRATKEKKSRKKEKTLQDKVEELDEDDLKEIAVELGVSKKELRSMDEEEIVEYLFDEYEEEDIEDVYNELMVDEDLDEEDEDE